MVEYLLTKIIKDKPNLLEKNEGKLRIQITLIAVCVLRWHLFHIISRDI